MDLMLAVVLRALMNRRTWTQYKHILSEDSFRNTTAVALYLLITELHASAKRNVTENGLLAAIQATTTKAKRRKELSDAVSDMMTLEKEDLETAGTSIRRFAAYGYAQQAAQSWFSHGDDPSYDYAGMFQLVSKAHQVSQGVEDVAVTSREVGLPGDDDMIRHAIPFGWSQELDDALLGGQGRGELTVLLAPPKRGKTSYLISAAANSACLGNHVLYFTLEIARRKVFLRYFQTLSKLTYIDMLTKRQLVGARRAQVKGELHVLDYSMGHLTPSLVEAETVKLLDAGVPVSHVVIDYMELMRPDFGFGKRGVDSRALGDMVVDLRRTMVKMDVTGLSAWQVNRGGADKVVFGTTDISESWEVVKHADALIGMNQGPEELKENVMRLKVLEQRESPARPLIYLHSDMRRNLIKPLEGLEAIKENAQASKTVDHGNRPRTRVHRNRSSG